ncbi:MAG: hypothetical protein RI897_1788 [Verrucomicrobiota bacterium]
MERRFSDFEEFDGGLGGEGLEDGLGVSVGEEF